MSLHLLIVINHFVHSLWKLFPLHQASSFCGSPYTTWLQTFSQRPGSAQFSKNLLENWIADQSDSRHLVSPVVKVESLKLRALSCLLSPVGWCTYREGKVWHGLSREELKGKFLSLMVQSMGSTATFLIQLCSTFLACRPHISIHLNCSIYVKSNVSPRRVVVHRMCSFMSALLLRFKGMRTPGNRSS